MSEESNLLLRNNELNKKKSRREGLTRGTASSLAKSVRHEDKIEVEIKRNIKKSTEIKGFWSPPVSSQLLKKKTNLNSINSGTCHTQLKKEKSREKYNAVIDAEIKGFETPLEYSIPPDIITDEYSDTSRLSSDNSSIQSIDNLYEDQLYYNHNEELTGYMRRHICSGCNRNVKIISNSSSTKSWNTSRRSSISSNKVLQEIDKRPSSPIPTKNRKPHLLPSSSRSNNHSTKPQLSNKERWKELFIKQNEIISNLIGQKELSIMNDFNYSNQLQYENILIESQLYFLNNLTLILNNQKDISNLSLIPNLFDQPQPHSSTIVTQNPISIVHQQNNLFSSEYITGHWNWDILDRPW